MWHVCCSKWCRANNMNTETKSTCCYCGTGCGVVIDSDGRRITGVRGDKQHPANFGRLCARGASLADSARLDYRLLHPRSCAPTRCTAPASLLGSCARPCPCSALPTPFGPTALIPSPSGGPVADRGLLRLQQAGQRPDRYEQLDTNSRLCMSLGRRGLQADARCRCATVQL